MVAAMIASGESTPPKHCNQPIGRFGRLTNASTGYGCAAPEQLRSGGRTPSDGGYTEQ